MDKFNFEHYIAEHGKLVYTCKGDSMYPFIQPNDLVVIEAVNKPLKKYDVPLYKRDNGQYVLHRIEKVKNGEYVICGDNRIVPESGITDRNIIGVLTKIIRNGEELDVDSGKNKVYVFFKYKRIRIRRLTDKIKRYLR